MMRVWNEKNGMICKTGKDRMKKIIWLFGKRCELNDIKNRLNDRCTEDIESLTKICLSYATCAGTDTFFTSKQFDAIFDMIKRFDIMIEFICGFIRDIIEKDETIYIDGLAIDDACEYTYIINGKEFETKGDVLEYIGTISDLEFNSLVKAAVYGLMKSDMDYADVAEMLTPKTYDGTTLIMKYLEQAEVDDAYDINLEIDTIRVKRRE